MLKTVIEGLLVIGILIDPERGRQEEKKVHLIPGPGPFFPEIISQFDLDTVLVMDLEGAVGL